MGNKVFEVSHYRQLSKLVRLAKNLDAPLAEKLLFAWESTANSKTCIDGMRARFFAVLSMVINYI